MSINTKIIGKIARSCVARRVVYGLVLLTAGQTAAFAQINGTFGGGASALLANATLGPLAVNIGSAAQAGPACQGTEGRLVRNTAAGLMIPGVASVAATEASSITQKTAMNVSVKNEAKLTNVSLLNGLITADAIIATGNVTATQAAITPYPQGSNFVNLVIGGQVIAPDVRQNSVIPLPGLGTVTLRNVTSSTNNRTASILVEMLKVKITQSNMLGLPVGAELTVARSGASFTRTLTDVIVSGRANALTGSGTLGGLPLKNLEDTGNVSIPCDGTQGKVLTATAISLNIPNLLTYGGANSTGFGGPSGGGTVARTATTVDNLNLLGGLIRASALTSVAQDQIVGTTRTSTASGSQVTGLSIAGILQGNITTGNVTLPLPGIGEIIVNEQVVPPPGTRTPVVSNALHVKVTTVNLLGLPVGLEIIVAHADAFARKAPVN